MAAAGRPAADDPDQDYFAYLRDDPYRTPPTAHPSHRTFVHDDAPATTPLTLRAGPTRRSLREPGQGPGNRGTQSGRRSPEATPRSRRLRRARRITGLATGAAVLLGIGVVAAAPNLGQGSGPSVTTSSDAVPRPGRPVGGATSQGPSTSAGPTSSRLGGPIAITTPRTTTTSPKLSWAPPKLTNPLTVAVAPGNRSLKLDPARDYTVVLPKAPVNLGGGVTITGGHNVVIIGGVVQVPSRSQVPSDNERRGLYLKSQTGTIHVEGVHLTGDLSDGFNLAEDTGAVVQIENVWIDLVHGSKDTHHADVIQTWAGPKILRVDGLRAATQYQGFFLLPNQFSSGGPPDSFVFRRTLLTMMPDCGYALWLPEARPSWLDFSGITVRIGDGVSPDKLSWPDSALGLKVVGPQAAVDLPLGTPGAGYASPGYA